LAFKIKKNLKKTKEEKDELFTVITGTNWKLMSEFSHLQLKVDHKAYCSLLSCCAVCSLFINQPNLNRIIPCHVINTEVIDTEK
jgi:hypothetical protein